MGGRLRVPGGARPLRSLHAALGWIELDRLSQVRFPAMARKRARQFDVKEGAWHFAGVGGRPLWAPANLGGLTGVVETICPSGSSTNGTGAGGRRHSHRAWSQPRNTNSVPIETSGSSTSVAATSSGIPVSAVDKAADAGISENTRTYGAIIADFNNDTKPDIFLGRHGEQPSLYENAGNGHFQETNQARSPGQTATAATQRTSTATG